MILLFLTARRVAAFLWWGFGSRTMWREEMDLMTWAFPLHGLQNGWKKKHWVRGHGGSALCSVSYTFAFPMSCLERRKGRLLDSGCGWTLMLWMSFGPKYSFFHQEVSQWPPSGLTVCLQAVELSAAAPPHLHHSVSKETTPRESGLANCLPFVYLNPFCILGKETQFQTDVSFVGEVCVSHHLPSMLSGSMHCCAVYTLWSACI